MEFLFSCSTRHLTRSLHSLVSYRGKHSKINSISTRAHVLFSIFFLEGTVANPAIWLVLKCSSYFPISAHGYGNLSWVYLRCYLNSGREIAPNTGANATKFLTLATKSWKLVAKMATRMFHHNLTKRYSELKRFAKINPRQTSSLSLFPKCCTCISVDNLTPSWI